MTLMELARTHGRTLRQLGVYPTHAIGINGGWRRAGPKTIATIAASLRTTTQAVAAACDESWRVANERRANKSKVTQ
jgi:hypothetical protein